MRVHVILRGGVGDIMLYMLKFDAIEQKHKQADIYCYLSSTWPEGCKALIEKHTGMFKEIKAIPYARPISQVDYNEICITCDEYYDFEIWNSSKEALNSIYELYPELAINYFPSLQYNKIPSSENVITFQPIGKSWGDIWGANKWSAYLKPFEKDYKIFLLGEHEGFDLREYANEGKPITEIAAVVDAISNSKLFIGVDSGFKNIALAQMTPTLLIWATQKEIPQCIVNRDTWFPPYYQKLDWVGLFHIHDLCAVSNVIASSILNRRKTVIIIPVHNELNYTELCYKHIIENTKHPYRIIFINNGSTDDTRVWLHDRVVSNPNVTGIHNETNLGFAKAVNQGMKKVKDEDVMLLNNDVEVTVNWLEKLHVALYAYPNAGIVGPITNKTGTPAQIGKESLLEKPKEAMHLSGFCYLIKSSVFKEIGYLDEKYFIAGEDYAYNNRVKKIGYKLYIVPSVFVYHHHHITAKNLPNEKEEWRKSRDMFLNDYPEER